MLPRKHRIVREKDFKDVLTSGKSTKSQYFKLVTLPSNSELPQVGVIVSNKVSKKAVERNRIRRIIKTFVKSKIDTLQNGLKVVIIAGPQAVGKSRDELNKDLESLFSKHI